MKMKSNPTPALPLSGEGAQDKSVDTRTDTAPLLAPSPDKGEAGRGLTNKTRLHNLKPQINHRRQNRKNPTEPEKRFWSWVRGKQLGCKFRRQHGMGQYIVDFYCAEQALIIELDGESHFTAEGIKADKLRTDFLESKGFRVLRFSNLEVMQNKEGVLITLVGCLNTIKSNPTPALPLSGEGAQDKSVDTRTDAAPLLAPPPDKGEAGRGLTNKTRLHNLKPQINHRRQNRKNPTEPEKRFWSWVRGKQLGCKFRRQHGMGQYIVDFYCAEQALIIELDGESHFTFEGVNADKLRTDFLKSKGFKILRFSNLDIMQNKEGVLSALLACLNSTAIKSNPTPTLPLSGEGAQDKSVGTRTEASLLLAPSPDKGEAGRGLKTIKVNDND